MLTDKFHRVQDYLRISLTDSCNLRCGYCMPGEMPSCFTPAEERMQAEEVVSLAKHFISLGVKKIRLTGGEPLMRKDFSEILSGLSEVTANNVELALTTNGVLLHRHIDQLGAAGIHSVNVSLDTLLPERFEAITRRPLFHRVLSNIHLLLHHDFRVKLNVVVMQHVNAGEIPDFIRMTRDYPLDIRFIEFMPFRGNNWGKEKLVTMDRMLELARHYFDVEQLPREKHETAVNYRVPGFEGRFGFIPAMSEPFCGDCSRLRLTSAGKLKNCLFSAGETDLLHVLRNGGDVAAEIVKCVVEKKEKWGGRMLFNETVQHSMVSIGG